MEKKNTVLLTVIAVATLLVAVVGATFAYFTATTSQDGTGTATTGTTTTIGSVAIDLATTVNDIADIKYPGGKMVNGASVTATVTGDGTFAANYKINATVDASALASNNTTVKYALYRTTSEVTSDVLTGCTYKTEEVAGTTKYYYTGCTVADAITKGTNVKEGTITISTGTKTADISVLDNTSFTALTSAAPKTVYYYLVVEYVNNDAADVNQNDDMGKTIRATITSVSEAASTATKAA